MANIHLRGREPYTPTGEEAKLPKAAAARSASEVQGSAPATKSGEQYFLSANLDKHILDRFTVHTQHCTPSPNPTRRYNGFLLPPLRLPCPPLLDLQNMPPSHVPVYHHRQQATLLLHLQLHR